MFCPKHVELHINMKSNFDTLLHLVGFFGELYYDAWIHEHQVYKTAEDSSLVDV
jgi:hypothetical protein